MFRLCGPWDSQHKIDHIPRGPRGPIDYFVFAPYLYTPILRGLPKVAHKAILHPCLHFEAYAFMPQTFNAFAQARKIAYLSHGEGLVAENIYGPMIIEKSLVVGSGIERESLNQSSGTPPHSTPTLEPDSFFLYLGRRDPLKGADDLVSAFKRWREGSDGDEPILILAGPGGRLL